LYNEEANEQNARDDKQRDNAAAVPSVGGTPPLQGKQEADNAWDEQDCSLKVHQLELFPEFQGRSTLLAFGEVEKEDDEGGGNSAKGQVDIEAPSPGQVVGEGTPHTRMSAVSK
jgi:hypothetical protein